MNIVVLGSAGQIGRPLVHALRMKHNVTEWDIANGPIYDLREYSYQLFNIIKQCDFVFYLACDVGGAKYLNNHQNSADFIFNNMKMMINTFDILRKTNIPFIFTSSQMSELHYSTYGQLKSLGEKITDDIGGLKVRLWNVYGMEHVSEKSHVITDFIYMARTQKIITCLTDGSEARQMLYVDDCVRCFDILMNNYQSLDKTNNFHITSFNWTTIKQIAQIVGDKLDCPVVFSDAKDNTQQNAMNLPDPYILNIWQPKISITEGIGYMIEV